MKKISGSGAALTEPFVVGGRAGMQGKGSQRGASVAQRPAEAARPMVGGQLIVRRQGEAGAAWGAVAEAGPNGLKEEPAVNGSDGHSALGEARGRALGSGSVSERESDGEIGESETGGSTYYFDGSRRLGAGHVADRAGVAARGRVGGHVVALSAPLKGPLRSSFSRCRRCALERAIHPRSLFDMSRAQSGNCQCLSKQARPARFPQPGGQGVPLGPPSATAAATCVCRRRSSLDGGQAALMCTPRRRGSCILTAFRLRLASVQTLQAPPTFTAILRTCINTTPATRRSTPANTDAACRPPAVSLVDTDAASVLLRSYDAFAKRRATLRSGTLIRPRTACYTAETNQASTSPTCDAPARAS
ncbi:hypothetical protein PSPO01_15214 [Paraphaeosphaeria sporulosa]